MSKLNIKINYKTACILKHATERDIKILDANIKAGESIKNERYLSFDASAHERHIKERDEEQRTLERFTEELDREKERLNIK